MKFPAFCAVIVLVPGACRQNPLGVFEQVQDVGSPDVLEQWIFSHVKITER